MNTNLPDELEEQDPDLNLELDSKKVENAVDAVPKPPESGESSNLFQLIHDDNSAVAELFFQFTQAEEDKAKQQIFDQISDGLHVHSELVEDLLYPLVVETAEDEDKEEAEKLVAEAEAGNYIAALIVDELSDMSPDEEYFEAKMTILCELVKQQVKREEKEMFDKLRAADIDFEDIAVEAFDLKASLEEYAHTARHKSKAKLSAKAKRSPKPNAKANSNAKSSKSKPKAVAKPKSRTSTKPKAKASVKSKAKAPSKPKAKAPSKPTSKKGKSNLPKTINKKAAKTQAKKKTKSR